MSTSKPFVSQSLLNFPSNIIVDGIVCLREFCSPETEELLDYAEEHGCYFIIERSFYSEEDSVLFLAMSKGYNKNVRRVYELLTSDSCCGYFWAHVIGGVVYFIVQR